MTAENELLPVGSVVDLDGVPFPVVIVGRGQLRNDGSIWDYLGYPYPEGFITDRESLLFSRDQIKEVRFVGLKSKSDEDLVLEIEKALGKIGTSN